MEHEYLVRYGLMGRVSRFWSGSGGFEHGQAVVVRSQRGTELGEVLIELTAAPGPGLDHALTPPDSARLLRAAGPDDIERAHRGERDRDREFTTCQRVVEAGAWPIDLIDVESLLDDRRIVLHYLGPQHVDLAGLRAAVGSMHGLDVLFEPVGADGAEPGPDERHALDPGAGCGHCGSNGGCGSAAEGGCGSSVEAAHAGCSGCAVRALAAASERSRSPR
jgi:hypothetical protein